MELIKQYRDTTEGRIFFLWNIETDAESCHTKNELEIDTELAKPITRELEK